MKLFIYLFSIAVATLLFIAEEYYVFGAYIVIAIALIWTGNAFEKSFINHN